MDENKEPDALQPENEPPPENNRGSLWRGFGLCWGFIVVWLGVVALLCPRCADTPLFGLASLPIGLLAVVLLGLFVVSGVALMAGGKSRTMLGIFLGLVSTPVLLLFMLFVLLLII